MKYGPRLLVVFEQANFCQVLLLQKYYGPSCNEAVFRDFIRRYKLADLYTAEYIENYEFTDEELYAPSVRYVLISAPESATEEEKAAAEAKANEILEASPD